MLDFGCFVLIWWQSDKKTRTLEAELQGPVYFGRTTNCIIGSDNICQHRIQWSICNTHNCARLTNAKSE